ncbi:MAG TPA: hypothetical protein VJ810_04360, partial [Blastocatellia bacterium]|nr:hypothetical protein [Blastocatellia bacterium]
ENWFHVHNQYSSFEWTVFTACERSVKEPKRLPAINAGIAAFGITSQQSDPIEEGKKSGFPLIGEYTAG